MARDSKGKSALGISGNRGIDPASAPYRLTGTNVPARTCTFTARATTATIPSITLTSAPITVTVGTQAQQAQLHFVHPDHLNTPRAITNAAQQVVWRWDNTDPFGNNAPNENPAQAGVFTYNLRFPGQYFDKETGLHYNYFRDYDPATGRYAQSDPIGLRGGINTYAYMEANPVNAIDPTGLACVSIGGTMTCSIPGGPTVTLPRPSGFPDKVSSGDKNYHETNVVRDLNGADPNCVMQELIINPTQLGPSNPASPNGTLNLAYIPLLGGNNVVKSYRTVAP